MTTIAILYAITLLDQWTKHWVHSELEFGSRVEVLPGFFDVRRVHNTGAAWGILSGYQLPLIVVSLAMLFLIVRYRERLLDGLPGKSVTLGLMTAGIVGNLIDRLRLGYVVDFLDFHWRGYVFPAFNVADIAICTGVGLYVLTHTLAVRRAQAAARAAAAAPQEP